MGPPYLLPLDDAAERVADCVGRRGGDVPDPALCAERCDARAVDAALSRRTVAQVAPRNVATDFTCRARLRGTLVHIFTTEVVRPRAWLALLKSSRALLSTFAAEDAIAVVASVAFAAVATVLGWGGISVSQSALLDVYCKAIWV